MAQIVKLRRSSVSGQKPTNSNLQLGELALNTTDGKVYMAKSGSLGPSVEELILTNTINTGSINISGSINLVGNQTITGSLLTRGGIISGSQIWGDGSNLINLPIENINTASLATTGSNIFLGNQTITGSINITGTVDGVDISDFSSSVDFRLNSVTASGGISAIFIADEGNLQGTASYFDFTGPGVTATVNAGTASISISGGGGGSAIQGASQTFTQVSNDSTWSINHSINSRTPIVEVYDNDYNVIIPTGIFNPGSFQTLIYFDVPQRGFAIISTGGGLTVDGANAILDQASPSSTWTFNHNLGTKYPVFNIFDSNDDIIIPQRINVVDENIAVIYFSSQRTGKAVASVGGDVVNSDSSSFSLSSSFATNANFLDGLDSLAFVQTGSFQSYTSSFSSSVAVTTSGLTSTITSLSSSLTSSIGSLSGSIATTTSDLSSSVGSLSSSVASINNTQNGRLDSLETESGSIKTDFNSFTSSYTTGSFTGSFIGNGSGLFDIPASGVTGLQLNKIISGNASASIDNTGLYVNRNVFIDGTLSAKELNITLISSSVLFESGSTKFGDTSDDTHQFTGSVYITGDLEVNSITGSIDFTNLTNVPSLVSGSPQISYTGITNIPSDIVSSSTQIIQFGFLETSSFNTFTSSYNTGSFSGSFEGDGTNLFNIPASGVTGLNLTQIADGSSTASISQANGFIVNTNTIITGSLNVTDGITGSIDYSNITNTPTLVSGSSQIIYSGLTGIPENIVSGSDQLTGSYDTRYVLSGSITQTTWDNIANKPNDIVSSSSQISAFGFLETSSFNTFTSSYNTGSFSGSFTGSLFGTASHALFALSASSAPGFTTNMEQTSAAATWSFVHNLNTRNPILQVYDDLYNQIIPNEIVGIDEMTAEIRFDYSQAGYAIASNGGGLYITGSTARINQASNESTWSFTHNLGTKYPSFEVFDSEDNVIIPAGIKVTSVNTAEIYFATPTSGIAIANFSGIDGSLENSLTSSFSLATNWDTIQDNPITGSLTSATAGTTTTVVSVPTGSYYGAFFDYVVISGSNSRAGTLMSTWNGGDIVFNETTTTDIGNTNQVTMSVDLNGADVRLKSTNIDQWLVKSLVRLI